MPEGETFDASPWEDRLIEAMDDDINTGDAIGVMFDFIRMVNSYLHQGDVDRAGLQGRYEKLKNWLQLFGLEKIASELPDEEIAQMIESRAQARFARNFAKADAIREKLLEQGIHLEDTAQGVRWWRE